MELAGLRALHRWRTPTILFVLLREQQNRQPTLRHRHGPMRPAAICAVRRNDRDHRGTDAGPAAVDLLTIRPYRATKPFGFKILELRHKNWSRRSLINC